MKKLIGLMAAVAVLSAAVLSAETVMVQVFSGSVKVKTGDAWVNAKVKMKLDDSAFVQVAKGSKLQLLTASGQVINITTEKSFQVKELFAAVKTSPLSGKLAGIRAKLGKGGGSDMGPTAVAGVRGADVYQQSKQGLKKDLYWEE
jgi:hypothetical protein